MDEVLGRQLVEMATPLEGYRRHRVKTLVNEVLKRRATVDQILKVYGSRAPDQMENHVLTVLRIALTEWFFVPPPLGRASATRPSHGARPHARPTKPSRRIRSVAADQPRTVTAADFARNGLVVPADDLPVPARRTAARDQAVDVAAEDAVFGRPRTDHDAPPPVARGPIAASAVDLVGANRAARGFVNGILRAVDRAVTFEPGPGATPTDRPRDGFTAVGPGGVPVGMYRFDELLFADPEKKPATWLGQYQSLPRELAERFVARYGLDLATDVAIASNAPAALTVRVNTRRTTPEAIRDALTEAGASIEPTDYPEVLRLRTPIQLTSTEAFARGEIYLQDYTSTKVAHFADLKPGMSVLDACAAPGGKITHAIELLRGDGTFTALDISGRRLVLLEENLARLGHAEVQVIQADLREAAADTARARTFDRVFIDAPCSNTGVLSRRADARWRFDEGNQRSLIKLQFELVEAGLKLLSAHGMLVYSTCTIEPEECRGVLQPMVDQGRIEIVRDELWLPEPAGYDGGYHALIRSLA